MPVYELKCKRCNHEFDKLLNQGCSQLTHKTDCYKEDYYIADGKEISKKQYDKCLPDYKIKRMWCPKCFFLGKGKIVRRSWSTGLVYDDDIRPGSGWATVDKRHDQGMYWDQDPATAIKTQDLQKEMKEAGRKKMLNMAKADEDHVRKNYRKVTQKEAEEYLRDPKRNSDIAVIDEAATNT